MTGAQPDLLVPARLIAASAGALLVASYLIDAARFVARRRGRP